MIQSNSANMTSTVKETIVVPATIQRRAGISLGDRVKFTVSGGVITITHATSRARDDERNPDLRAQIHEGLDDIRTGRVSPRFDTVDQMLASLKAEKPIPRSKPRR